MKPNFNRRVLLKLFEEKIQKMTSSKKPVVLTLLCFIITIGTFHSLSRGLIGNDTTDTSYTVEQLQVVTIAKDVDYNMTTCSERAFNRGSGQKVFAFSFYGGVTSSLSQVRGYFEGIEENLKIITQSYPGHLMRVYVDVASEHPILKELKDLMGANSNLDVCDVNSLPGSRLADAPKMFPMVWRFFPTLDPQVNKERF